MCWRIRPGTWTSRSCGHSRILPFGRHYRVCRALQKSRRSEVSNASTRFCSIHASSLHTVSRRLDVSRAVRDANAEVGRACLKWAGASMCFVVVGMSKRSQDLEQSVISVAAGGVPVRLRDVATVQFGPEIRRGAADFNGKGEAVGGIVVMRIGSNALT